MTNASLVGSFDFKIFTWMVYPLLNMSEPIKKADELLFKHWLDKSKGVLRLPIDPYAIAAAVGLHISDLPPEKRDLSGEIEGDTIYVNPAEPRTRKRFTIAHELGHFVLEHGHSFRDPSRNFSYSNYEIREVEANKFAVELLMPELAIKHFVINKGITDAQLLADRFDVSLASLRFRLTNLGLIDG